MENLKKQGWILSESGLKLIESSGSPKNLIKTLLDRDLREIGAGIGDLSKGKFENLDHELAVLQVLKTRNISAPKANESSKTAPKLLKLTLTDGVNTYSAIEMDSTPLSIETKPGTKIALKVKHMKMSNGQLLFTPKNIEILGGYVEALVAKWEVVQSLAGMKGSRIGAAGGPPAFIPFGQKIQTVPNADRSFKSLQPAKPKESENDDSEFKAQRQDAIAEASKAGTKKTFGGGSKTLVDTNVQKIIDKGFTEDQAQTALKYSRNNVEKALSNLKRRDEHQKRASSNDFEPREYSKEKRGHKGNSEEPASSKPSGAVSLFDFLENKIPTQESTAKQSSYSHNERFENNMSSSFRKHDKDISTISHHWSGNEQKSSHNVRGSGGYNAREYRDGGRDQPKDYKNNRDYRDNRDSRDNRDNREHRDYPSIKEGESRRDSKHQQSNSSFSSKPNFTSSNQKPSSAPTNTSNASNYNNSSASKGGKYQKPDYNSKPDYHSKPDYNSKSDFNSKSGYNSKVDYNNKPDFSKSDYNNKTGGSQQKDYNSYSSTGNNNNGGNYNSNKPRGNNPSKYYNEQQSNDYQKSSRNVVESMDKLSLKGNHQQYKGAETKLNSSNYPPLTPLTEQKSFSKSGYPIVGFQNKEANESAKNALKTKNFGAAPHSQQHPPPQSQQSKPTANNWQQKQQHQQPPPKQHQMPVQVVSQQTIKNQPPPPFPQNLQSVSQSAPAPMHTLPQPFVQHQAHPMIHAMPATVMSGSQAPVFHQSINYPTQIMMQGVPPPPGMGPPQQVNIPQQMKVGDACLAKYWEDGQFYSAKVTGVSESTFVVLFTEYGNAEEVRKTDCVPLIPACPTPPQPTSFVPATQMNAKMPHHNYHHQTPLTSSMPYKSEPAKNYRRN